MRPSNRCRGSTRWSSTEMIVYVRARGSGSGSSAGESAARGRDCSTHGCAGSRTVVIGSPWADRSGLIGRALGPSPGVGP
jgi:hypothetical protein